MSITPKNIDDVIRNGMKRGQDRFYWSDEEWNVLRDFCKRTGFGVQVLGAMHYPKDDMVQSSYGKEAQT